MDDGGWVYASNSVNVLAKWGAVASLKDPAAQADVKMKTVTLRNNTTMTGVMMAPPAIRLAKIGTKVPWRYASLKEFQLIVVSP